MTTDRTSRPLAPAEFVELDEALASIPEPFEPMDAATLDGFLVALLLLPSEPSTADWLPRVFDAEARAEAMPADPEAAARLPDLILRRYHELDATLGARRAIDPVVFELEDERGWPLAGIAGIAALEPFALGFLDAAQRWPGVLDSDNEQIAAALIGILRHLPEESIGDLLEARYELDVEAPLANLNEAIGDLATCVAEIAAITRGFTLAPAAPRGRVAGLGGRPQGGAHRGKPNGSRKPPPRR